MSGRFHGELVVCVGSRSREERALPHLDVLWHYDCVMSPRSAVLNAVPLAAKLHADATSPRSPFHASVLLNAPSSEASCISAPLIPCSPTVPKMLVDATDAGSSYEGTISPFSHPRYHHSDHQRAVLRQVFCTFDADGDGYVSIEELSAIFIKLGIPKLQDSIQALLVRCFGNSISNHINEEEFFLLYDLACCFGNELCSEAAMSSPDEMDADAEQDLRAVFHLFDLDGNGFISPCELQRVLCSLGFEQARELDACVDMIARADENEDGHVDFSEFKKLMGFTCPNMTLSC